MVYLNSSLTATKLMKTAFVEVEPTFSWHKGSAGLDLHTVDLL